MQNRNTTRNLLTLLALLILIPACAPRTSETPPSTEVGDALEADSAAVAAPPRIPTQRSTTLSEADPATVAPVAGEVEGRLISNPVSPEVRMRSKNGLATFTADALPGAEPSGRLVAVRSQKKTYTFDSFPARADLSDAALGGGPLHLWMRVEWKDEQGNVRQGETFFTPSLGVEEPASTDVMRAFDLATLEQDQADDALRIRIPVTMEDEGKVSVVIDDADGQRVRSLVSGKPLTGGDHHLEWDGRREDGTQAPPGDYNVRVLTHPGLSYDVLYRFANGGEKRWDPYGPTHVTFRSMCSNGEKIQASAAFTEGGHSTVVMDLDGNMSHGWHDNWSLGNKALFHVSGEEQFYAIREKSDEQKNADGTLTQRQSQLQVFAFRWDSPQRGNISVRDTDGSNRGFRKTDALALGETPALTGAVKVGEKVYIGDRLQGGVQVYRLTETGSSAEFRPTEERYPVPNVGCLATDGNVVYLASGKSLGRIDPGQPGRISPLGSLPAEPTYLAAHQDRLYALHEGESQIFVYDLTGKPVRKLGEPGGAYVGPWRKERLVNPTSLFFGPDGSLWVTEERYAPKRLTRWDVNTGKVMYEKLGSESYGSPGCGLDPDDPTHWIAQNAEWRVNPATGEAEVIGALLPTSREGDGRWNGPPNRSRMYKFVKRDGRTFVIGNGSISTIYELKNHRLVPLALVGTPGIYSFSLNRKHTCEPLIEAYDRAFAEADRRMPRAKVNESVLMLWVDQNGNELLDADEIEFGPAGSDSTVGYWGNVLPDLTFGIQVTQGADVKMLKIQPQGWTDGGAPRYSLADAWNNAVPVRDELPAGTGTPRHSSGFGDTFGRSITVTSNPYMLAFDAQGHLDWYIQNPHPGVHGSQAAPLPVPGEFQGLLFSMGIAPFSDTADVTALMNNHGRVFFLTTDGVLLDELFDDVRVASTRDHSLIGGEAFGGSFQKDAVNNRYILQGGGGGARVYQIKGLDQIREQRTTLSVSAAQLQAAARLNPLVAAESRVAPTLRIPRSDEAMQNGDMPRLAEWTSGDWRIELNGEYDAKALYLTYTVWEPSPWVNRGVDWPMMFKTGDCVDFQISTQPTGRESGLSPIRVLASPKPDSQTNQVVVYRHRLPPALQANANPMEFNSPIRDYKVDDVRTSEAATVAVSVDSNRYVARLTLPFSELGLRADQIAGQSFKADFGVIFGDREGQINLSRVYWSNKETGLVNDVPGEMMPTPNRWGTITFEPK